MPLAANPLSAWILHGDAGPAGWAEAAIWLERGAPVPAPPSDRENGIGKAQPYGRHLDR